MPSFDHSPLSSGGSRDLGVLIIHGFTGSPHSMRPLAQHFVAAGYPVEMPLLPGHGTNWEDLEGYSYRDWVEAVDEAYWRLRKKASRVLVAGLSMGGGLAIVLSARRPVAGTILVNPYLVNPQLIMAATPYLQKVLRTRPAIGSDIAQPGVEEGAYTTTPVSAIAQLHGLGKDIRRVVPALRAPVLFFRSRKDHIVSDKSHRYFMKHATCPVEFTWLEKSYHVATLDYDAQYILDTSLTFAETLG